MSRLRGRVAPVTGGARGIGAATAERLADEDADVAILDLDEYSAAHSAQSIAERTERCAAGLAVGVTSTDQVNSGLYGVATELGRLDISINNAGVIAVLAGDDVSSVTGQTIYVDEGRRR